MRKNWGISIPLSRKVSLMATSRKSATSGTRRGGRSKYRSVVHKARGAFHPRVQKVGPEHFGLVCIDCAKARSKFMVVDF